MKKLSSKSALMLQHIHKYHNSGKSLKAYCSDAGLPFSTMQYWYYKKYRQGASMDRLPSGFTEVTSPVNPIINDKPIVEVVLPNGTQIIFNNNITAELLKAFL